MDLHKLLLTKNDCYKVGAPLTPKGIMVHSTGANNPTLRRYVNPDDGLLGVNQNNNHWNQPKPDGRQVCVHGFIGLDKNQVVRTYQTLPWNMRGWHCGGKGNDTHISFEICEDGLKDSVYFGKVYQEAVELCAYLCKEYKLDPVKDGVIIDHSEGYARGIASNHGDVKHWFPKFGKNMNSFREDVKNQLSKEGDEEVLTTMKIKVNDGEIKTISSILRNDLNYPNLREIADITGYTVGWDSVNKVVSLTK